MLQKSIPPGANLWCIDQALGLTAQSDDNFIDVSADYPYYEDIKTAKALGIAKGVGDNRLEPNAFITRQDMMSTYRRSIKNLGETR